MLERLFFLIYFIIGVILPILLFPLFIMHTRGRRRLAERYGFGKAPDGNNIIWFHAASLGELKGFEPLFAKLKPGQVIYFTSTSVTAIDYLEKEYPDVQSSLFPFDNFIWFRRSFKNKNISAFVFAETEIWPALLLTLKGKNIPAIMVNAKVLDKSIRFYQMFPSLFRPVFASIQKICAATKESEERFRLLGARDVIFSGNMKYASLVSTPAHSLSRNKFFADKMRPLLVVGSIRKGEEKIVFSALKKLEDDNILLDVLIAPRQLEQVSYFERVLKEYDFSYTLRTAKQPVYAQDSHSICLLDTIGELSSLFAFADFVFIGGTLVPGYGGHNPLEAAKEGKVIMLGPFTENVDDVIALNPRAFLHVKNAEDIKAVLNAEWKTDGVGAQALALSKRFSCVPDNVFNEIGAYLRCAA